MPRSVTFNGQTIFKPGGLTKINANALAPIGLSATGIIALLGEATDGTPRVPITIDDPALGPELFGTGPLPDAINIAFNPSTDPRIPGGAFRCICYKTNLSTVAGTHMPGATGLLVSTAAAASTTTAINWTGGGLTVNAHIDRWLLISGEQRRIVSNTAVQVTVSPGFSTAPAALTAATIMNDQILLTSRNYGETANQIAVEFEQGTSSPETFVVTLERGVVVNQSPDLGGYPFLTLEYVGGPIPASGTGNTTTATTSVVTFTPTIGVPGLNVFAGMVLQFPDGLQRLILSNTAASPTAVTLAAGHELTTVQAAAIVASSITVSVRNVLTANVSIGGTFGSAKTLVSTVTPTADNLNITFSTEQTLNQLVNQINSTTNYYATVPNGLNGDTTLMSTFDFGTRATAVDCRFDQEISPATRGNFRRDLQVAVDWINDFATLATATRATLGTTEGSEIPAIAPTGGPSVIGDNATFFVGGSRGISASSDFQNGFDAFLEVRVNHIVPLISENLINENFGSTAQFVSVAAQLSDHVKRCAGIARSERGGYIGMEGTKTQLLSQAAALNNTDVQLYGQKLTVLDAAGNLVQQPEWSQAVAAAGMRSGAPEIGEPLTFKFINTNGLSQDPSWSPRSITDVNALIQGGVMFAEQPPQGGFRFVRDETTYLINDNIAFVDGNTRDAVRFLAYDLRTLLEEEFTGLKAKPATAASIRSTIVAKMELYRQQSIIVDSLDPETQSKVVPGYRNLRIFISGNVANIKVEIFPVTGIIFQLTEIFLQLPIIVG